MKKKSISKKELANFNLLKPYCNALSEKQFVAEYEIAEMKDLPAQKLVSDFCDLNKINSEDELIKYKTQMMFSNDDEFHEYLLYLYKRNAVMKDLLSGTGESLFLRYKDRLDRVLYSLLRVDTEEKAYEIYYAIESNEIEFGEAAHNHSLGPESETQGLVGPVDLTTPHPEIAAKLRVASPRQLFPPFKADEWHVILRLEYRYESKYDQSTKDFLGKLILNTKSRLASDSLYSNILKEYT